MSQYVTASPCTILTSVGSTKKNRPSPPYYKTNHQGKHPYTNKHPNQTNPKCSKYDQENRCQLWLLSVQYQQHDMNFKLPLTSLPYCFCNHHFTGSPVPNGTRGAYDLIQQPLDGLGRIGGSEAEKNLKISGKSSCVAVTVTGLHYFHWQPAKQCQVSTGAASCPDSGFGWKRNSSDLDTWRPGNTRLVSMWHSWFKKVDAPEWSLPARDLEKASCLLYQYHYPILSTGSISRNIFLKTISVQYTILCYIQWCCSCTPVYEAVHRFHLELDLPRLLELAINPSSKWWMFTPWIEWLLAHLPCPFVWVWVWLSTWSTSTSSHQLC